VLLELMKAEFGEPRADIYPGLDSGAKAKRRPPLG